MYDAMRSEAEEYEDAADDAAAGGLAAGMVCCESMMVKIRRLSALHCASLRFNSSFIRPSLARLPMEKKDKLNDKKKEQRPRRIPARPYK